MLRKSAALLALGNQRFRPPSILRINEDEQERRWASSSCVKPSFASLAGQLAEWYLAHLIYLDVHSGSACSILMAPLAMPSPTSSST